MIFATLEGLTAEEQETYEAVQRAAGGRGDLPQPGLRSYSSRRGAINENTAPKKVLDLMQPGVAYRARDILKPAQTYYATLQVLMERGLIKRSGERMNYRFEKVAA